MGARPSVLTDAQWEIIYSRCVVYGESRRIVAKEYGINESAIRKKFPSQGQHIRAAAKKIFDASTPDSALEAIEDLRAMPYEAQKGAFDVFQDLQKISSNLAKGAVHGSETFAHLSAVAAEHAQQVSSDLDDPDVINHAKRTMALTQTANAAAEASLKILTANKGNTGQAPGDSNIIDIASSEDAIKQYQKLLGG